MADFISLLNRSALILNLDGRGPPPQALRPARPGRARFSGCGLNTPKGTQP